MITALEKASPSEKEELCGWLTTKVFDPDEKIKAVTAIFDNQKIREITDLRIKDFYKDALASLEHLNKDAERKAELFNFASYLLNRQN